MIEEKRKKERPASRWIDQIRSATKHSFCDCCALAKDSHRFMRSQPVSHDMNQPAKMSLKLQEHFPAQTHKTLYREYKKKKNPEK